MALPLVNVAQVPQVSPLRYPGGKSWFYPYFRAWMVHEGYRGGTLIEPFAGGASISLQSLVDGIVSQAVLVERDEELFTFWRVVLDRDRFPALAGQVLALRSEADLMEKMDDLEERRSRGDATDVERALLYLLRNRTNYGGITARGASRMRRGEKERGVSSRWYLSTLSARLSLVNQLGDRISVVHGDGVSFLEFAARFLPDAVVFADPPYLLGKSPGTRLYDQTSLEYGHLLGVLATGFKGRFLLTHSPSDELLSMAKRFGLEARGVPMRGRRNAVLEEVVVASDASWMQSDLIARALEEAKQLRGRVRREATAS